MIIIAIIAGLAFCGKIDANIAVGSILGIGGGFGISATPSNGKRIGGALPLLLFLTLSASACSSAQRKNCVYHIRQITHAGLLGMCKYYAGCQCPESEEMKRLKEKEQSVGIPDINDRPVEFYMNKNLTCNMGSTIMK